MVAQDGQELHQDAGPHAQMLYQQHQQEQAPEMISLEELRPRVDYHQGGGYNYLQATPQE